MATTDFKRQSLWFSKIYTQVLTTGSKSHMEFQLGGTRALVLDGPFSVIEDETYRGVFGYLSFGESRLGQMWWYPPQFINFKRQVFLPPPKQPCNVLRIWTRPLVVIEWHEYPFITEWRVMVP